MYHSVPLIRFIDPGPSWCFLLRQGAKSPFLGSWLMAQHSTQEQTQTLTTRMIRASPCLYRKWVSRAQRPDRAQKKVTPCNSCCMALYGTCVCVCVQTHHVHDACTDLARRRGVLAVRALGPLSTHLRCNRSAEPKRTDSPLRSKGELNSCGSVTGASAADSVQWLPEKVLDASFARCSCRTFAVHLPGFSLG